MRHSAKGMYEFLGDIQCPSCKAPLVPIIPDCRVLKCGNKKKTAQHKYRWNYDAQDWSSGG